VLEQSGLMVEPEDVERLLEHTEGWPVGIYLAALALQEEDDVSLAIERFYGDDRLIADYLRDEFLAGLTAADLDFLTRTSILDRLSGSLCDTVLERQGSAEILIRLAGSKLLIELRALASALGNHPVWAMPSPSMA
jgi:LuxR family maltose regulon positive regulatory protein